MIGIFDSGLGGLSALKEIKKLFPNEDIVYFGDTGRVPYGTRSVETIKKYALQDMAFLMTKNVRAVVAACGTVSSTALGDIRSAFSLPVIGVVEGAAKAAAQATKNNRVAVIGTSATIKSCAYDRELNKLNGDIEIYKKACPMFVPLVENGIISPDDEVLKLMCERYLADIRKWSADTLILGCTHYPIIKEAIGNTLPGVTLVDTGKEAAKLLREQLGEEKPENGTVEYFVSDDVDSFTKTAQVFLGDKIEGSVKKIDINNFL